MTYVPPAPVLRRAKRAVETGENPRALDELTEWSLTMDDVALVCGVTARAARFWYTGGRKGVMLATRAYDTGAESPRRVTSVRALIEFCDLSGLPQPDWALLPAPAQARLGVTPNGTTHLPPPGVGVALAEVEVES